MLKFAGDFEKANKFTFSYHTIIIAAANVNSQNITRFVVETQSEKQKRKGLINHVDAIIYVIQTEKGVWWL